MIIRSVSSVVLLMLTVNMASCQSANNAKTTKEVVHTVSVTDFGAKLQGAAGAQVVDVRTPEEYAEGHLQNAMNINFNSDYFAAQVAKLDKTKAVYVYCRSGGRSGAAVRQMQEMGFVELYNMDGGMLRWKGVVVK